MRITLLPSGPDTALESHRPRRRTDWQLVTMGFWSESPYHGGAIAYSLANPKPGTWLLQSGEWSEEEDELREETDYHRIIAVAEDVPAGHDAVKMAKMLYKAWIAAHPAKAVSEQDTSGLLDVDDKDPAHVLAEIKGVEGRRQAVAADLAKKRPEFTEISGLELAELLNVTPGETDDRIHLCAIDEDETAAWIQEEISQGQTEGTDHLEKILPPSRMKKLRRHLEKVEEGEDVDAFPITRSELKRLAPLRAKMRLEEGEIDQVWSYDHVVAPDGTKLTFTFSIGEDGEVRRCLATPYDGRLEPDPKEYVWE